MLGYAVRARIFTIEIKQNDSNILLKMRLVPLPKRLHEGTIHSSEGVRFSTACVSEYGYVTVKQAIDWKIDVESFGIGSRKRYAGARSFSKLVDDLNFLARYEKHLVTYQWKLAQATSKASPDVDKSDERHI
jgi:hypothetical protein